MNAESPSKFGPIVLAPGIRPKQLLFFLVENVCAQCAIAFVPLMQPYVLTEQLHIPGDSQGRVGANLAVVQNVAMVMLITLFGALADRFGRRRLLGLAMLGFALGLAVYPLAPSLTLVVAVSFFIGIAYTAQAAGGATSVIDYPDNASRGKFVGLMLIVQSVTTAVIVGKLLAGLPKQLIALGNSPVMAGRYAFWVMAAMTLVGAGAAFFGLTVDRKSGSVKGRSFKGEIHTIADNIRQVLGHARTNPRFKMALIAACVLRGDFVVVQTFLSLWVSSAARAQGMDAATAFKSAGTMYSIVMVMLLIAPPIVGYLADRIDRVKLLMIALGLAGFAYASPIFVNNVFGFGAFIVAGFIGLGEGAMITATQSLMGQEAPERLRGSAMGIFVLLGIGSVTVINFVGGFLFDKVSNVSPFVMMGVFNFIMFAYALRHLRREGGAMGEPTLSSPL